MRTFAEIVGWIWLGAVVFLACGLVVAWALSKMGERLRRLDEFQPWDVFDEDDPDDDYIDWLERRYRWHSDNRG